MGNCRVGTSPDVAEAGIPDALGSGVVMTSAVGYTAAEFAAIRRSVGERAWALAHLLDTERRMRERSITAIPIPARPDRRVGRRAVAVA